MSRFLDLVIIWGYFKGYLAFKHDVQSLLYLINNYNFTNHLAVFTNDVNVYFIRISPFCFVPNILALTEINYIL